MVTNKHMMFNWQSVIMPWNETLCVMMNMTLRFELRVSCHRSAYIVYILLAAHKVMSIGLQYAMQFLSGLGGTVLC